VSSPDTGPSSGWSVEEVASIGMNVSRSAWAVIWLAVSGRTKGQRLGARAATQNRLPGGESGCEAEGETGLSA
jgi:hypothetical protein